MSGARTHTGVVVAAVPDGVARVGGGVVVALGSTVWPDGQGAGVAVAALLPTNTAGTARAAASATVSRRRRGPQEGETLDMSVGSYDTGAVELGRYTPERRRK